MLLPLGVVVAFFVPETGGVFKPAAPFLLALLVSAAMVRLDIAAGTAVRFEPGQTRDVQLIPISGDHRIFGFNGKVMGDL